MTLLVAIVLATMYATYVVTRSDFPLIEWLRIKLFARYGEGTWQAYLATCTWCASFYIGGLMTLGAWIATDVSVPILVWWASAGVTGVLLEAVDLMRRTR